MRRGGNLVVWRFEVSSDDDAALPAVAADTGETEEAVLRQSAEDGLRRLRLERAFRAYRERDITSGEAAATAGVGRAEFPWLTAELGVKLLDGPSTMPEELASLGKQLGMPDLARFDGEIRCARGATGGATPLTRDRSRLPRKWDIHADDAVERNSVVHRADFDFDVVNGDIPKDELVQALLDDELTAANAVNAKYLVGSLDPRADLLRMLDVEQRPARASVDQHAGEGDRRTAADKCDFGKSQAVEQVEMHGQAGRITSQKRSVMSSRSRSVWWTISSRSRCSR